MTLSILLAILKAIPSLKSWWDELTAAYIASEISSMKKENVDAINKAFKSFDQRAIEKALGSSREGVRSGVAGSTIIDDLPRVQDRNPPGS